MSLAFFFFLDAYYVLSNKERRREYDNARRSRSRESENAWSTNASHHAEAETVFGGVFEELLRPEVQNPTSFYSPIGMASGAALGFICGGLPGAVMVCAHVFNLFFFSLYSHFLFSQSGLAEQGQRLDAKL